jgi:NADPH:quinone reductase-like Zn-dependent oxidoreductase
MRAVRFSQFGDPQEVLEVEDLPDPEPGPGQVRVRMHVRPINPSDIFTIRGMYGSLPRLPATPGLEGMGVVDRLGHGVSGLSEGDRVVPLGAAATWQEYLIVAPEQLVPVPDGISDQQAAMLVVNPATAWLMLREDLRVREGEWVLQNAANSAVGTMVIQLSRRFGFRTINVVRRREVEGRLRELGADEVVCEADEDVVARVAEITGGRGVRHALESVGGASGSNLARCLGAGGTMLVFGAISREPLTIESGPLLFRGASIRGWWLTQWFKTASPDQREGLFRELFTLIGEGAMAAPVAREFDLAEVREAVSLAMRSGEGKILLKG